MPDSVPNYLTTNPDGTVGADFSGKISAQGITLPTGGLGNQPPDSTLAWTAPDTGQIVGSVAVGSDAGSSAAPGLAELILTGAANGDITEAAQLSVFGEQGAAGINVFAPGQGVESLYTSNGNSGWVRVGAPIEGGINSGLFVPNRLHLVGFGGVSVPALAAAGSAGPTAALQTGVPSGAGWSIFAAGVIVAGTTVSLVASLSTGAAGGGVTVVWRFFAPNATGACQWQYAVFCYK